MKEEQLLMLIKEPHTSEKSTVMAEKFKQFTFKVLKTATKRQIKVAVEKLFNVKVRSVSVMNVAGKAKRFRQMTGKRCDWKKAYVSLEKEYDIDFTVTE